MQIVSEPPETIDAFLAAIQRGKEALQEAGRILIGMIDADPSVKYRITEAHPEITEDVLEMFERIGRRQVYHELCLQDTPAFRALRRCPYSEQTKFFKEPIPLLLTNGENLLVHIHAMAPQQVRQCFGSHRVRTLPEQRAFLEGRKAKIRWVEKRQPYTVGKGFVTFHEPVKLTTADMARILSEMAS